MFRISMQFLVLCAIAIGLPVAAKAAPKVVVSIKPLHSIVSAVMQGVGKPELIVSGNASPHDFALKPSQAKLLQDADLIFWVGHELELFLEKPLKTIAADATAIELMDAEGLVKFEVRDLIEVTRKEHDHEEEHAEHEHEEDHDEHKHEEKHAEHEHEEGHDDHKHEEKHAEHDHEEGHDDHKHEDEHVEHKSEHEHGHAHEGDDPHIWLDPQNAEVIAGVVADALAKADSQNAELYRKNSSNFIMKLDELKLKVGTQLEGVNDKPYLVMHDAFQYFERRFGLMPTGSIMIHSEQSPGAGRISKLKKIVQATNLKCVFTEPQLNSKPVKAIAEGAGVEINSIDPLGADLENGPELYPALIRNIAASFTKCLSH